MKKSALTQIPNGVFCFRLFPSLPSVPICSRLSPFVPVCFFFSCVSRYGRFNLVVVNFWAYAGRIIMFQLLVGATERTDAEKGYVGAHGARGGGDAGDGGRERGGGRNE